VGAVALATKRLILVLGKGGVGRTTVAAALGAAAANAGREVLVAEVSRQARLLGLFGHPEAGGAGRETPLRPRMHGLSIDPGRALEEYLGLMLPLRALGRRLAGDHAFSQLAAAAPGLRELVTIGKLWYLAQDGPHRAAEYDVVIADLPATGHGLAMLRSPSTFSDIASSGRLHRQTSRVAHDLTDPRVTGAVVVALPQELPVNEAISLARSLRTIRIEPTVAIANARPDPLVASHDVERLDELAQQSTDRLARAAAEAGAARGRADHARAREVARLARDGDLDVFSLPFSPAVPTSMVDELAARLDLVWAA
jgi:anion-transporting  ArsA/GET3 family ATPase